MLDNLDTVVMSAIEQKIVQQYITYLYYFIIILELYINLWSDGVWRHLKYNISFDCENQNYND